MASSVAVVRRSRLSGSSVGPPEMVEEIKTSPIKSHKPVAMILEINPHRVRPMPKQPREFFDQAKIKALAESIKKYGQRTPGLVRAVVGDPNYDFELVDGERRLMACLLIGNGHLFRAELTKVVDRKEQYLSAVIANHQGEKHSPAEIVHIVEELREYGVSDHDIAIIFGKSQVWVSSYGRMSRLHPDILVLLHSSTLPDKRLSVTVAVKLSDLPVEKQLKELAKIRRMPALQARHEIYKSAKAIGAIRSRKRNPSDELETLENFVRAMHNRATLLEEKITAEMVESMLANRKPEDQDKLLKVFTDAVNKLDKVRERIANFSRRKGKKPPRKEK